MSFLKSWFFFPEHRHGHGVHSPFAYSFIRNAVECKLPYYAFAPLRKKVLEERRKYRYSNSDMIVNIKDLELIFRVIVYCRIEQVLIYSPADTFVLDYIVCADSGIEIITEHKKIKPGKKLLIVVEKKDYTGNLEKEIIDCSDGSVLIGNLRNNNAINELWSGKRRVGNWRLAIRTRRIGIAFNSRNITEGRFVTSL